MKSRLICASFSLTRTPAEVLPVTKKRGGHPRSQAAGTDSVESISLDPSGPSRSLDPEPSVWFDAGGARRHARPAISSNREGSRGLPPVSSAGTNGVG